MTTAFLAAYLPPSQRYSGTQRPGRILDPNPQPGSGQAHGAAGSVPRSGDGRCTTSDAGNFRGLQPRHARRGGNESTIYRGIAIEGEVAVSTEIASELALYTRAGGIYPRITSVCCV